MPEQKENWSLPSVSERQRELFLRKSSRIAASYLRRVESFSNAPDALYPFLDVLRCVFVDMQEAKHPEGTKTIGTYCLMVPNELIYSAGAMPVRLCSGSYTAYSFGDDVVPRDACPLVKAVMGFSQVGVSPLYQGCAMMVIPVTCDCKKKLAGMLETIKPTIPLHVPPSKDCDADVEQYLQELYRLVPALEKVTGNQITEQTLAQGIDWVGYAQYEMSKFLSYRRNNPALLYGTQVMAVMNAYAYMPVLEWAKNLHKLNAQLALRLQQKQFISKGKKPRVLITGSPITFPNVKLPLLIEEMGGLLVADETCMGERALYDPLVVLNKTFDGMMRALANRYTRPCTCPSFTDNSQRVYRIKQMIADHQVEGVIYHVLRGCLVYDFEFQIFEEALGEIGIPVIRMESDYNEEDVEQLRIRVEAFIELIKLKSYAKNKWQRYE